MSRASRVASVLLLVAGAGSLRAQGLPEYRSLSPIMASRTALGFQPVLPEGRGWHGSFRLDYGNVLESQSRPHAELVLDGELMRLELALAHSWGRWFVQGALPLQSAQRGKLDGFINWWHGVFGFNESVREARTKNQYEYTLSLPDSTAVDRDQGGVALGDARLSLGLRHSRNWQTVFVAALPTNGRPEGWGLQAVALGITTTARAEIAKDRLLWEGSFGLGYTPTAGRLPEYQRTTFVSASAGLRLRVIGQQSVYGNLMFHSSAWHDTTLPALDNQELSLDFGFLLKPGNGPEILAGMVEDPYPFGPAVDLVLRLGVRW